MRLGYNLTLEQAQKLVMTPELQQAIQLLQFTSHELNEYLENEMETNPLLEVKTDAKEHENIDEIESKNEEIDWEEFLENYDDISYTVTAPRDRNEKEITYDNFITYSSSLKEHLLLQLNLNISNEIDKIIGELIIESIDQNGYLITSIESLAKDLKIPFERVEKVLLQIQTFDPIGIGARDLKECLMIQLRERKIKDENIYLVVENYLEDIAHNRLCKISKKLGIELKDVQDICDYIKTLEPKPGRCFSGDMEEVKYITPDITLRYLDGEYIIILNDNTAPRLNINRFYKGLMASSDDPNITEFITKKLNSAMWIIKSIEQRRMTIYNVVESILKFQSDFFEKGEKALKPLTLKDVADDIGVHESTVSRATNGKYMQTPRGLFELKYFFTSGVSSEKGSLSATSIKVMIRDMIEKEDSKKPLSDQKIADILKEKSISISRRTVAKYRDELDIPSSSKRRRY
ncbi:RNA polymerase factor sigma-54 [Anaerosalibacter massiliensis]|uniref:RNA polymerase factor sigma-54 n=1 Tax=Anaerosalibacter massiliensis TaxID=1347392 RepID=A0A9X2MDQ1_9FIRM|nr:RNA polymerase factor sigma-54 [Anaerosalibacter massiliensis]MCR2043117.1 RNA polymerase factor sigma-54 [Anaerosalibacter massiliensis]